MVTLAELEAGNLPPSPENKDALSPLELQRHHDLHHLLWRRRGAGMRINPRHEMAERRFPAPWSVEDIGAAFVVKERLRRGLQERP